MFSHVGKITREKKGWLFSVQVPLDMTLISTPSSVLCQHLRHEENHNNEMKAIEAFLLKGKKIQPGIFRRVTSEVDITKGILGGGRRGGKEREKNTFSTPFPL